LKRTAQALWLLMVQARDGSVWLTKRPNTGIWAGLYCPPVFESREALDAAAGSRASLTDDEPFVHVLTHKDLHLHPVRATFAKSGLRDATGNWFTSEQWPQLGLPAPIRKLLAG
jgi:A/G-specific adenine glycosylase